MSLQSLTSHPFFSSLAISTLNFLDPTTFASKPREEKATFLRGLVRVLPNFSERLKKGKILLSLLEEMKDPYLLPFLLPNVFEISKSLSKEEFAVVLAKLQPLFALKDPPQNMLSELEGFPLTPALLENMSLFEEKTSPALFRESELTLTSLTADVMPLIYNSLDSEHLPVQERVLKSVPHLCEILDYGTVQNILLTKIAVGLAALSADHRFSLPVLVFCLSRCRLWSVSPRWCRLLTRALSRLSLCPCWPRSRPKVGLVRCSS